jgi:hypothetical protein
MNMKPRKKQRIDTEAVPVEAELKGKGKHTKQKERIRPAVDDAEESSEGEDFDEMAEEEELGTPVISFCLL